MPYCAAVTGSRWSWVWRWGAVAGLLWVALVSWSLATPVGSETDSDYHLARLYCAAGEIECVPRGSPRETPCYKADVSIPAECSDLGTRPYPRSDIGDPEAARYPPFFYPLMSVWVGDDLGETTLRVRVFNSTLAVVLALASVALSAPGLRRAVALSWLVASVPLGMSLLSGMNPNAWALLGIASFWGPLLSILAAPGGLGALWGPPASRRLQLGRAAFVLSCTALGLAGRSETQVLMPIAAFSVTIMSLPSKVPPWPNRQQLTRWLLPLTIPFFAAVAYMLYSRGKVGAIARYQGGTEAIITEEPYAGWDVIQQIVNLVSGFAGLSSSADWREGLGNETPMLAMVLVVSAYAGAGFLGLSQMYGRKALAVVAFVSGVFTLMAWLWSQVTAQYFQPRYFLPVGFVFIGLMLLPRPDWVDSVGWVPRRRSTQVGTSAQWALVLGALVVANSLVLLSMLLRYGRGVEVQRSRSPLGRSSPDLDAVDLWSLGRPSWWWEGLPVGPFGLWIVGSGAFAGVAALVWWWVIRVPKLDDDGSNPRHQQSRRAPARPIAAQPQLT